MTTPSEYYDEGSYEASWPDIVTKQQALYEIERHYGYIPAFYEECGDKETYNSMDVLAHLGY